MVEGHSGDGNLGPQARIGAHVSCGRPGNLAGMQSSSTSCWRQRTQRRDGVEYLPEQVARDHHCNPPRFRLLEPVPGHRREPQNPNWSSHAVGTPGRRLSRLSPSG